MKFKKFIKKTWHFIWYDDSLLSWIINIILAFVLIKFVFYPAIGLILGTHYPIVAVVSNSMEHEQGFNEWWDYNKNFYENIGINKEKFSSYKFKNGFNKGDIMLLKGKKAKDIQIGDVIVFNVDGREPIIHRVIKKWEENNKYYFQTKGDHNPRSIWFEEKINEDQILGIAFFRIPLLGWIKIGFVELIKLFIR